MKKRVYPRNYQKITPHQHGVKGTQKRISNAKKMATYERIAEERGVPVSRVIAEDIM